MAANTKTKNLFYTRGASIDANYGPWSSFEAYRNFLISLGGNGTPKKGAHIAIEDSTTGAITTYIYEVKNSVGSWKAEGGTVDLTEINNRLDALEADKNAAIADKITSSISVTPARFYKGVATTVSATGTISLPAEVNVNKISAISITDGTNTDSGSQKTSVSLSDISAQNSSVTFTLTGTVDAPYTKSISKTATCTACDPIYVVVVPPDSGQTNQDLVNSANLFYVSGQPVTSIKGKSKSITFTAGSMLYVLCHESGVTAKGASQLAPYPWIGSDTTTINGVSYTVYASQPQQAHTDVVTFN